MPRAITFFLLALATSLPIRSASAHEGHDSAPKEFTESVQHAPTPLPDRVVLTWTGDPSRSIDVTWRTRIGTGEPIVQCVAGEKLRGDLRREELPGMRVFGGKSEQFESDLGVCVMHTAHVDGLEPATMYAYRVGDGQHWSEWHQFRTASDSADPFTFVYFGDAQNSVRSLWSRVVREANQHAPRAAFMLHAGDLINRANRDAEWGEWFEAGGWLNGMIPSIATPGNHEYSDGLSRHWRPHFAFPENGPEGLEETAYWLDYQGARIISLNSNENLAAQVPWLKEVLEDPDRPKWTILTFHHPVYSAAKNRDNAILRSMWRPLIEKYGVDLVLTGHDHAYARSGLGGPENVNDGVRAKVSNTVYVVSVSGPKMYELQETWEVPRVASGVQLFQVIHVSQEQIRYEARLATGELYDAFDLEKTPDGVTTLTEVTPEIAEVRSR